MSDLASDQSSIKKSHHHSKKEKKAKNSAEATQETTPSASDVVINSAAAQAPASTSAPGQDTVAMAMPVPPAASEQKAKKSKKPKKSSQEEPSLPPPPMKPEEPSSQKEKVPNEANGAEVKSRKIKSIEACVEMSDNLIIACSEYISKGDQSKSLSFIKMLERKLKTLNHQILTVQKSMNKKRTTTSRGVESGFMKPIQVSPQLLGFLGQPPAATVSRAFVTKSICKYIKDKNLQNPQDRRKIIPDETLGALLKITDKSPDVTYCSIQELLKPHFTLKQVAHP